MTGAFSLAVHALVFLNHKQATLSSDALACNICTNPARVRQVMAQLKRAGLVSTKEGHDGGYAFTGKAESVTLKQVAQAVGARFVQAKWRSGSDDMDCLVASGMAGVLDSLYDKLDQQCQEELNKITIQDLDVRIFGGGPPESESVE